MMNFPMHTHNAAVIIVPTEWSRIRVQPEKKFFASKSRPQSTEERDYGIGCEKTCESDYIFRPPLLGQRANHILRCKSLLRAGNETMRKEETEQNRLHISIASTKLAAVDGAPSKPKDENRKKPDRRRASAVSHAIEVSAMNGLANATNSLICPRSAKEMKVSHKLDRGLKFLFFTRKTLHCVVGRRAVPQHTDNETTFRSRSHFFFSFASTSTGDNTQFFISFEFFRRRSFVVAIASVSLSCSLCVREGLRRMILFFLLIRISFVWKLFAKIIPSDCIFAH